MDGTSGAAQGGPSRVYAEFEAQLAGWRAQYASRPDLEMQHLFLLALEREQNVTVAYREEVLSRRLERMPLAPAVREIFRRALTWIWKDEEMHTVYVRGALLEVGGSRLAARTLVQLAAGAIGGWTVSVQQHKRWSEAPVARAVARVVTSAGELMGRVPPAVLPYLSYGSFQTFCRYNVETEGTAWLSWGRLAELAQHERLSRARVAELERGALDEDRHRRLFRIMADALTPDDRLRPGVCEESLTHEIRAVDEAFLPRARRRRASSPAEVGRGGTVFIVPASRARDRRARFRRLLLDADLPELLERRAQQLGHGHGLSVAVKCSFMGCRSSTCTDPELMEALAVFLREHGAGSISVLESEPFRGRGASGRSVRETAQALGFSSAHYRVVDAASEQMQHPYPRGMAPQTVARSWKEAEVRISFAKLRRRRLDPGQLTLANVEGVGGGDRFPSLLRQAQRTTSIMMLIHDLPPHFFLLEGAHRLYASADGLALDQLAAKEAGLAHPRASKILREAEVWLGASAPEPQIVGLNEPGPAVAERPLARALQSLPTTLQELAGDLRAVMPERLQSRRRD